MIPVFEQYAFALQPGQVSVPFESQFGWHIVKVDEMRLTPVPTFEQMATQLRQQVLYAKFDEMVSALKADADIQIVDPSLAPPAATEAPAAESPAAEQPAAQ
jgi:peptidyl-prolyl cis-trans isomerase C